MIGEWRRVRLRVRTDNWSRALLGIARRKPGRPDLTEIVIMMSIVTVPARLAHAIWVDLGPVPESLQDGCSAGLAAAWAASGVTR